MVMMTTITVVVNPIVNLVSITAVRGGAGIREGREGAL